MNTCPKCQTALHQVDYQQLTLLQCETCSGFWFQEGQFRQVKSFGFSGLPGTPSSKNSEAEEQDETTQSREPDSLSCPECEIPLAPYIYAYSSGIQLHRCSKCAGIWAAYDDLIRIEHLLADYQESLEDAKSKIMPLMMKVKQQIQEEEQAREAEKRNNSFFHRVFRHKSGKNQSRPPLLEEVEANFPSDEKDAS
ncbi:hypothetical protein U14_00036 [Candidatus Moduliflexus flocculans]|uniref:Transcription factor zinc-finger domain-containing protein n=1 Tax=Candidatus Moduliflexus flocculans TaxID=1499966 RepID=A0A0S6VTI2_9BACT|nr:hypothetical protein U14_00036 [Candidatus Moduliflexus flocculans]